MFFRISFLLLSVVSSLAIAADETEIVSFTAVTISIDEKGNGKFTVDTRPVEEAHKVNEPLGQPVEIKSMEPASVYKLNDGRLHLRYDFSKIKSLDTLKSPVLNEDEEKLFLNCELIPTKACWSYLKIKCLVQASIFPVQSQVHSMFVSCLQVCLKG